MYKTIYVPVDNSEHSNACIDMAMALGKAFAATLVGSHAYAAKCMTTGLNRWNSPCLRNTWTSKSWNGNGRSTIVSSLWGYSSSPIRISTSWSAAVESWHALCPQNVRWPEFPGDRR